VSPAGAAVDEARLLATQGRRPEAIESLDRVLAEAPDDVAALLLRGRLRLEERDSPGARLDLERAARLAPRSAEALNGLARSRLADGLAAEALELSERAGALLGEGDNFIQTGPVYLTRVWCLREQRRYREALAAVEEGLRRCDDALLAEWGETLEEELAESERERC